MSTIFYILVSAHAFKWNKAGNVKAIGVHVTDPRIERNLSNLSPSKIVIQMQSPTTLALVIFLNICLFLDFSQPSKIMFSQIILTG
jgi:hypothetical protein